LDQTQSPGSRELLTDDVPLIENHVLDSLGLFRTVEFLENRYGIEIDDTELHPGEFATLRSIADLVKRRGGVDD
jgi:acyl carrier protein